MISFIYMNIYDVTKTTLLSLLFSHLAKRERGFEEGLSKIGKMVMW